MFPIKQTFRRNPTNLSRLMSELCSFKCLKLYSLNFAIAHAQIKIVKLIKMVINALHKNTRKLINHLKQALKSISNLSIFLKNENCPALTKTNMEY